MDKEEYTKIKSISYPNTIHDEGRYFCDSLKGYTFKHVGINGEMASVPWIEVYKDGKKVALIKQSVCDIYF